MGKLEEIMGNMKSVATIDSLGRPVRRAIEKIYNKGEGVLQYYLPHKYPYDLYSRQFALSLGGIALATKSKDAVLQSAKTINTSCAIHSYYFSSNVDVFNLNYRRVSWGKKIPQDISEYLYLIATYTEDGDTVKESAKTIMRHDKEYTKTEQFTDNAPRIYRVLDQELAKAQGRAKPGAPRNYIAMSQKVM